MKEDIIASLEKLEGMRNGVPTYVFFHGIHGGTLIKARKDLSKALPSKEVDIILHSPGGDPGHSYRLIRTFREKYETVNVIVPLWAKSAATLFAFGANRIVLGGFGELGPIDAQIKQDDETDPEGGWVSALNVQSSLLQIEERSRQGMLEMFTKLRSIKGDGEIKKIGRKQLAEMLLDYSAKFYQPLLQKIEAIELGVMARYLDIGRMYAKRILKQYTETSDEKISALLDFLVYECPDHGYVVDYPVLQTYLPHIMKADREPFNAEYDNQLENLSMLLMESLTENDELVMMGFLKKFTSPNESDTIEPYAARLEKTEGKDANDRGPGGRLDQDGGAKSSSSGKSVA